MSTHTAMSSDTSWWVRCLRFIGNGFPEFINNTFPGFAVRTLWWLFSGKKRNVQALGAQTSLRSLGCESHSLEAPRTWSTWDCGKLSLPWQGGDEMIFKVPSKPSHPRVLWFLHILSLLRLEKVGPTQKFQVEQYCADTKMVRLFFTDLETPANELSFGQHGGFRT